MLPLGLLRQIFKRLHLNKGNVTALFLDESELKSEFKTPSYRALVSPIRAVERVQLENHTCPYVL